MENETTPMTAPSTAKYYVGDLCYVMHTEWEEVCDLLFPVGAPPRGIEGKLQLADGRRFALFSTAHGDGVYDDNFGRSYAVDSGSLGIIKVEDIRDPAFNENKGLGHIVELPSDFDSLRCESEDGQILFDTIAIETDWSEEDEENGYGWDDEDEDA